MDVHVERQLESDTWAIYVFSRHGERRHLTYEDGRVVSHPGVEGVRIEPFIVLPSGVYEDLVAGLTPDTPATDDAVKDARAVRDRLLYILEKRVSE